VEFAGNPVFNVDMKLYRVGSVFQGRPGELERIFRQTDYQQFPFRFQQL
jgi:hypothetical protein